MPWIPCHEHPSFAGIEIWGSAENVDNLVIFNETGVTAYETFWAVNFGSQVRVQIILSDVAMNDLENNSFQDSELLGSDSYMPFENGESDFEIEMMSTEYDWGNGSKVTFFNSSDSDFTMSGTFTIMAWQSEFQCNPDEAETVSGFPVKIDVKANDTLDGAPLDWNNVYSYDIGIVSEASGGFLAVDAYDKSFIFVPADDFVGTSTFTYSINMILDNDTWQEFSSEAEVTIQVLAPEANRLVANPDSASTPGGRDVTIDVLGNDTIDGRPVLLSDLNGPPQVYNEVGGSATSSSEDGRVTFSPDPGFLGQASFDYDITTPTFNILQMIASPAFVTGMDIVWWEDGFWSTIDPAFTPEEIPLPDVTTVPLFLPGLTMISTAVSGSSGTGGGIKNVTSGVTIDVGDSGVLNISTNTFVNAVAYTVGFGPRNVYFQTDVNIINCDYASLLPDDMKRSDSPGTYLGDEDFESPYHSRRSDGRSVSNGSVDLQITLPGFAPTINASAHSADTVGTAGGVVVNATSAAPGNAYSGSLSDLYTDAALGDLDAYGNLQGGFLRALRITASSGLNITGGSSNIVVNADVYYDLMVYPLDPIVGYLENVYHYSSELYNTLMQNSADLGIGSLFFIPAMEVGEPLVNSSGDPLRVPIYRGVRPDTGEFGFYAPTLDMTVAESHISRTMIGDYVSLSGPQPETPLKVIIVRPERGGAG